MSRSIQSVNLSTARPMTIDGREVLTGIRKQPVDGPVEVRPLGLVGDEQADPTVHGGLAKAVYAYPAEHYPFWRTVRAQARLAGWDELPPPGTMGENLTLTGLLETQVWIGDRLCFDDCELVVSAPRYPCFKFNAVIGFSQAAKLMAQSAWCGYYLAVRHPGHLRAGDRFDLVPGPREVGIVELFRARTAGRYRAGS